MIRRKLPPVLLVAIAVGILLSGSWLLFNRSIGVEEQVALEFDASAPAIVVQPNESYRQRFEATELMLRGFVIYAPSAHHPEKITVGVTNTATGDSVTSYRYNTAVRGDSQRLTFSLPRLATTPKDVLVATITNRGTRDLPLQAHKPDVITFSTLQPVQPSAAWQIGLIAAVVAGLFFLLIDLLPRPRWQWWLARLAVMIMPLLAVPGFWFATGKLGVGDWDYRWSLHEIYRRIIVSFHQFPWWNPYTCGGTGGLADPEFPVFSPTFLLELIFGIPGGTKLAIYFGLCILGLGMLTLAKSLRLTWRGALFGALVMTYSSAYILRVVEGHVVIIYAFMWVPWILWAWRNAYHGQVVSKLSTARWPILGGVFMALAFYQGGIHVLTYTPMALILLSLLVTHKRRAFTITLVMIMWCAGFSALKLLPNLAWLAYFPDVHYVSSTDTLSYLSDIFTRRHLHGSYVLPGQLSGWHEYGAYIGYVVLGLSLIALAHIRRSPLVRNLAILSAVALGVASLGPFLQPFFDYVPYIPRSNMSRMNLFTVLGIALLGGIGIDRLYRSTTLRRILALGAMSLVAFDVLTYSAILSDQTFTLPDVFPAPSPAPSPLAYHDNHFTIQKNGHEYYRSYPMTLAGYGSFSFCSVLGPTPRVATVTADHIPALVFVPSGQATLQDWSPNALTVDYDVPVYSQVVINMNYAPGWEVAGQAAKNDGGLLAAEVAAGSGQLTFQYRPPFFMQGAILTTASIMAALFFLRRSKKHTDYAS